MNYTSVAYQAVYWNMDFNSSMHFTRKITDSLIKLQLVKCKLNVTGTKISLFHRTRLAVHDSLSEVIGLTFSWRRVLTFLWQSQQDTSFEVELCNTQVLVTLTISKIRTEIISLCKHCPFGRTIICKNYIELKLNWNDFLNSNLPFIGVRRSPSLVLPRVTGYTLSPNNTQCNEHNLYCNNHLMYNLLLSILWLSIYQQIIDIFVLVDWTDQFLFMILILWRP